MIRRRTQSTRLTRTSEKQNKKQTLIFTFGTILIVFAIIQFGPFIIKGFGDIMYSVRGDEETSGQQVENEFLSPPVLSNIPEATQNQYITFQGNSSELEGIIEIYLNDEVVDEIKIVKNGKFEVKDLLLKSGQNNVKARFVKEGNTSPFSSNKLISYIKGEPKLEVSFPNDNASFSKADKNIVITGTTDPDNIVTINGFRAIVEPNGDFSYQYQLNDGANTLEIEARNIAGATVKKSVIVTYSP